MGDGLQAVVPAVQRRKALLVYPQENFLEEDGRPVPCELFLEPIIQIAFQGKHLPLCGNTIVYEHGLSPW